MTLPVEIVLPWKTPPTTANQALRSTKPKARALKVEQLLTEAMWAITAARPAPVHERVLVVLHFRPANNQQRDADGMFPLLKVVQDALVKKAILPGDHFKVAPAATCWIHDPVKGVRDGCMWVELAPAPAARESFPDGVVRPVHTTNQEAGPSTSTSTRTTEGTPQ
ncbi:hypothetical protein [Nocardioides bruguierae]|uniref:Uncharacterized protein n=1 Tax=Nocardioides bruguierae TaxID=2945102 RepID=A0A9X2DAZ2_9ACTN|nr:hypothetical protein [Nocardioides bruguierae]MCM0622603.1 hypothetical protein [Nocardioides bruguierae]